MAAAVLNPVRMTRRRVAFGMGWRPYNPPAAVRNPFLATPNLLQHGFTTEQLKVSKCQFNVELFGTHAEITEHHEINNVSSNAVELVYELDFMTYTITGLSITRDGKTITAVIKEAQEASETYDDAMAEGHGAVLFEKTGVPGKYKLIIGNFVSATTIKVSIAFARALDFEGEKLLFSIPSSLRMFDTEEPTIVDVNITAPCVIKSIVTTHDCKQDKTGDKTLKLRGEWSKDGKDFDVVIGLDNSWKPQLWVEYDDNDKIRASMILSRLEVPTFENEPQREFVFILDRSGSMRREGRMASAKDALQLFLRSLPEGSFFNILGFGTKFTKLFEKSVPYNDKNLEIASNHVDTVKPDLGQTKLYKPLFYAFNQKPEKKDMHRIFMVLTDGGVDQKTLVLKLISDKTNATCRLFSVGLGQSVAKDQVIQMARRGGGSYELVREGQRLQSAVIKQLNRSLYPSIANMRINACGKDDNVIDLKLCSPHKISAKSNGDTLLAYYLYEKPIEPNHFIVSGTLPFGNHLEDKIDFKDAIKIKGDVISKLATSEIINDLTLGIAACMPNVNPKLVATKHKIKELSSKYNVLSSFTSFVLVDEHSGEKINQVVPATLSNQLSLNCYNAVRTNGPSRTASRKRKRSKNPWDAMATSTQGEKSKKMLQKKLKRSADGLQRSLAGQLTSESAHLTVCDSSNDIDMLGSDSDESRDDSFDEEAEKMVEERKRDDFTFKKIIRLQKSNGSWIGSKVLPVIGLSIGDSIDDILATAIVLEFLKKKYKSNSNEWSLVALKANRWLEKNVKRYKNGSIDLDTLRKRACGYIQL